jgi:hypothetical protein
MTLEEKLRNVLQTPHQNSLGETIMTFPTPKLLEQIKQIFKAEGYTKTSHILYGTKFKPQGTKHG